MASFPLRSIAQKYAQHFIYLNGVDIVILTIIFISQIAYCDLLLTRPCKNDLGYETNISDNITFFKWSHNRNSNILQLLHLTFVLLKESFIYVLFDF